MQIIFITLIAIGCNLGMWYRLHFIMRCSKREILAAHISVNLIMLSAFFIEDQFALYLIIGIWGLVGIIFAFINEFKKKT